MAAGRVALNGTADDIVEVLQVGQYLTRSRDQEHATVAQSAAQADGTGRRTAAWAKAASPARAVTAARLAKKPR